MRDLTSCRYLRRSGEQCTAEAVDDQADLLLCAKHLGKALVLLQEAGVPVERLLAARRPG